MYGATDTQLKLLQCLGIRRIHAWAQRPQY